MSFVLAGLLLVFYLVLLAVMIALYFEHLEKTQVLRGLELVLFLVLMPKHESKKEGEAKKDEKLLISQMEQVLANFLHLSNPKTFSAPLSVSLEIASKIGGANI